MSHSYLATIALISASVCLVVYCGLIVTQRMRKQNLTGLIGSAIFLAAVIAGALLHHVGAMILLELLGSLLLFANSISLVAWRHR